MSYFENALECDLVGDIKGAIKYYKLSIDNLESIPEAYLNLIVILIQINYDYGFSSYLIANDIMEEADINETNDYLNHLLDESLETFGNNVELVFWKYYVENYFESFDRQTLLSIIKSEDDSLVPYFLLYINDLMNHISISYHEKIKSLKTELAFKPTFKNKYIRSLIDSAEAKVSFQF